MLFCRFQLVRGSGRGRSVHACSRNLPPTLRCYFGPARCEGPARQMCGASRHWGRILILFRLLQLVRGRGAGRSTHSCSPNLLPKLWCHLGARKMCGICSPDLWDKLTLGRILILFRLGPRRWAGGSVHSCSHNLPPTLRCDLGICKICGTSPPAVWDKLTLGRILILCRHLGVCKDLSICLYAGASRVEPCSGSILSLSGVLVMYCVLFQMRSVYYSQVWVDVL